MATGRTNGYLWAALAGLGLSPGTTAATPQGTESQRVYRNKVLVIDDAFFQEIHNLERRVNPVTKHSEPILRLDAPWDQKTDQLNYLNVLYDEQEDLFRMWYVVVGKRPGEYWGRGTKTAYATSKDGIHWEKPIMNMVEVNGSKQNNYIIPEMLNLTYTIIDDPSDIAARRYKMVFFVDSEEMRWAAFHIPLCVAYSCDGIHWKRPTHVNPVLRGISDAGWGFIYDPDRRKYQLYTRRVPNLPRDISLYESYDLVNWEDKGRVLVPGDEHDPPDTFNFQGMTPFYYEDFCLALLNTHYSLPGAETYEVYHKAPENYPSRRLGQVDVQLAYSRDGVTWSRPDDRSPVIANGPPGSRDGGCIFVPSSAPIIRNGETWIYYFGYRMYHSAWSKFQYLEDHDHDVRDQSSYLLAKMPEDQWVSLDAGATEGWILGKPWLLPTQVLVNGDVAEGGFIAAEFVTPYGKPVEGLTRAECVSVTASGKDQVLDWTSGLRPSDLHKEHLGGLCIKIYLKNAKLYSYSLVQPDPDGEIATDWANARWLEAIKHRSDNWDRLSTEPAAGVPARPGAQGRHSKRFGPYPRPPAKRR